MDKQNVQADEREDFRRAFAAVDAAFLALEGAENGAAVEVKCPICSGKAIATRSALNGHRHIMCERCGFRLME